MLKLAYKDFVLKTKGDIMKKFIEEFKKFITRGNVLDMAVGVIVGSSFTAIVNALSNNILKPFINFLLTLVFGKSSLSEVYTFLKIVKTTAEDGSEVIDLSNSIYIDWGAFINAIINFFIVAFVLFCIVKITNRLRDDTNAIKNNSLSMRAAEKEMKKLGINLDDEMAVAEYFESKRIEEEEAARKKEEEEKLKREQNPTELDLLKKIASILEEKKD